MSDSSEYADSDTEDSTVFMLACLAYMESDNDLLLLLLLLMRRRLRRIRNNNSDESDEESSNEGSRMLEELPQVSTSLVRRGTPATATSQALITQKNKVQGASASTLKVTARPNTVARCSNVSNQKLTAGQANSSTRKQVNQGLNVSSTKKPVQERADSTTQRMPIQSSKMTTSMPQRVVQGSKMVTPTPQRVVQGSKMITPMPQRVVQGSKMTTPIPQRVVQGSKMITPTQQRVEMKGSKVPGTQLVNLPTPKPTLPATLTVANVAAHNATYLPWKMPPNYANIPTWSLAANNNFNNPIQSSALRPPLGMVDMPSQKVAAAGGVNDHLGQRLQKPLQEQKPAAAGSSKRLISSVSDEGKKKKGRPTKRLKTSENEEDERNDSEDCQQDPFEMIEIEEPRIKLEIFDTEEFSEIKCEGVLPNEGPTQEKVHFEEVYCTPGIMKEEHQDDVETPTGHNTTEIDTLVPEFMRTEIKVEPVEEVDEEQEEDDEEEETIPKDISPLLWRCPLVSCPEMFSAELDMYQHLNLNHVVKGLALSSKSKKVSGPRSESNASMSTTNQSPNTTSVIPPSTSPSVAISGSSGLIFFTRASPPHVPVTTSQSVPSSSSGPVTVTATLSYSSLTTTSAPLVTTTVVTSSVPSISSASAPVMSSSADPTPCLPASSPVLVSTKANDSQPSSVLHSSLSHSPNSLPTTTTSQGLNKFIVAPISDQSCSSTGSKKFLLLTPQQPQQNVDTNKTSPVQPLQIFQPSEPLSEDLLACATDDSEMFSISLARFPESKRAPIKQKLVNVVDCIRQKNIGPEKLFIAYDNSANSRTM